MRKTFIIAALILSLAICNAVSAANYAIRPNPEIVTITFSDNIPRTAVWFTVQDWDNDGFPTLMSGVKSAEITDMQTKQCGAYPYVENPAFVLNENISDMPEEKVRFQGYYISEWRGLDKNKNGKIEPNSDPNLNEYEKRVNAEIEYGFLSRNFTLKGGKYELSVETANQSIIQTISEVLPGVTLPPVTGINAKFDANGRFNVAWKVPDVYISNPTAYPNATIQVRVDRYTDTGNKRYWRARVDNLPLFINGKVFDNYTFFQWESEVLRLTPYVKVQVRILLNQNNRGHSDWTAFKIDGSEVTPASIPVPLTQAQYDQLYLENISRANDVQQGTAGLSEIQSLLNTPLGQRRISTSFSGQLGGQLNAIMQMLVPPGQTKK